MSEKKRKRTSEEIERPSKKRVEESIAETLKFSILQDTSDWAPAISKLAITFNKSINE